MLNSDGPALGLIEDAEFECIGGRLSPGDGLLLFTDGLVETAERDISLGMDKLAGLGERLVQRGFDGGAKTADRLDGADQRRPGARRGAPALGGPRTVPDRRFVTTGCAVARWSPPSLETVEGHARM